MDTLAEKGSSYEKVREDAKNKIDSYASKFGLKNHDILIAPGIGVFPEGNFKGTALDYYYYILTSISRDLLKYSGSTLEVHLDLTHGLNLMPVLTYRAIKEMLRLLSIFKETKLRVYDADPHTSASHSLSINIIEAITPTSMPFNRKIKQGRTLEPINLSPEERRKLNEEHLKCIREVDLSEISAFLGALYNGLPLALYRFYPNKNILDEIISATLNTYERYIEVAYNDKLNVIRRVRFGKDFESYVFAYLTTSLLEKYNLVSLQKKEVTLSEIENLALNLFKFDERLENRIRNDIHILKKKY